MQLDQLDPGTLVDLVVPYALSLLGALLLLFVAWLLGGWVRRRVRGALGRTHIDVALAMFLGNLARWSILVMALLAALTIFGFEITAFAAVIGAAGLAIGLAFQGTLSNFASGMLLLALRPFTVGDVVSAGGVRGKVAEIQLFTTIFDTPDNRRLFVPNNQIFNDVIENDTFHDTRRVQVDVGASYDADVDETRAALQRAIDSVDGVLAEPASQIYLDTLGGSSVDWRVRVWVNTPDFWTVREALTRAVKMKLDEAGIGIPYPQMDIHVDGKLERP